MFGKGHNQVEDKREEYKDVFASAEKNAWRNNAAQ